MNSSPKSWFRGRESTVANSKSPRYFTAADDGLAQAWRGVCWMNPPDGSGIGAWMRKAHEPRCSAPPSSV